MGNEFREGGMGMFRNTGLSQEERSADTNISFEEAMERLRTGAREVVKNRRFADLIEALLKRHGNNPSNLTQEVCEEFLDQHQEFGYEPAMVRDVAEEIANDKKSGGLH